MSIRKMESFGWFTNGNETTALSKRWSIYSMSSGNVVTGRRTGSQAINLGTGSDNFYHSFDNQTDWIVHFAVMFTAANNRILQFRDLGNCQCSFHYDNTGQYVRFDSGFGGSTLGRSNNSSVLPGIWHHCIVRAKIHNTLGQAEVRIDGQTLINLTGVNTRGATANNYANQIVFSGATVHDIVICDGNGAAPYNAIMGDLAVYCTFPNGAGAVTGWTPAAGSNWQNVDDSTPDSDTTYNSTAAAGAMDRYALPSPTLAGSCRGVCVGAMLRKDDAGARTARTKLYDGTALQSGTTSGLADSYQMHEDIWQVNPTSGTHWTAAELAAAEIGVELVS